MWKETILVIALVSVIIASGCVEPATPLGEQCGNSVCALSETVDSCPQDCLEPPIPPVSGEDGELPPSLPF